jgi:hypothetical protein
LIAWPFVTTKSQSDDLAPPATTFQVGALEVTVVTPRHCVAATT